MENMKWEPPKILNLNDLQKAKGDCNAGSAPTAGDGNCASGTFPFVACSTGTGVV